MLLNFHSILFVINSLKSVAKFVMKNQVTDVFKMNNRYIVNTSDYIKNPMFIYYIRVIN